QQANDAYMEGWVVQRMGAVLATLGQFEAVRSIAAEAYELAARTYNWRDYPLTLPALTAVEVAMGAFDAAERTAQKALTLVGRYQAAYAGMFVPFDLACACALRGTWSAAEATLALVQEPGGVFAQPSPIFAACAQVYRQLLRTYATNSALPGQPAGAWCVVPVPAVCDLPTLSL